MAVDQDGLLHTLPDALPCPAKPTYILQKMGASLRMLAMRMSLGVVVYQLVDHFLMGPGLPSYSSIGLLLPHSHVSFCPNLVYKGPGVSSSPSLQGKKITTPLLTFIGSDNRAAPAKVSF
jgi:hypothetical protein